MHKLGFTSAFNCSLSLHQILGAMLEGLVLNHLYSYVYDVVYDVDNIEDERYRLIGACYDHRVC